MTDLTEEQKKLLEELHGPDAMELPLLKRGITPNRLATKLDEELEAFEQKAFSTIQGIKYSKKMPLWKIRQTARMDAHRLSGHYPAEKHEMEVDQDVIVEIVRYGKDKASE